MKTITLLLFMLISLTGISQTFEEVEHNGFVDQITHYENGTHDHYLRSTQTVPTELTNYFAQPCNASVCLQIRLGACPGDVNSEGIPYQFTDYQHYYVVGNTILGEYENLIIRNSLFEVRNGSIAVNGVNIEEQQDCDIPPEQITQISFTGIAPGQFYPTTEAMNQTLSVHQFIKAIPTGTEVHIINILGQTTKLKKHDNLFYSLPKNQILIIRVFEAERVSTRKVLIN